MRDGGRPRRSARIDNKRQQTGEDERNPKKMKTDPPPHALSLAETFGKRLSNVFSFRAAIPVINEYMSSIQIDDDDPGFLFDWQPNNVNAFVTAANDLDPAQAPEWLRTRPPHITTETFMEDVIYSLQPEAGDRVGWVLLAPNTVEQYGAIYGRIVALQFDDFLQAAARTAFPIVNADQQYLCNTCHLTDTRAEQALPNRLRPIAMNGQPLRQLFF